MGQCQIPELVEVKQENKDDCIGMVNLAQSASSLNITRNIRIDTIDNNGESTDEEAMEDVRRFIQRKLQEYNSANTATVKSESWDPPEMIPDANVPSTSGISVNKTPKKTLKNFARTKRIRESDSDNERNPSIHSKSPRLRNIRLIED